MQKTQSSQAVNPGERKTKGMDQRIVAFLSLVGLASLFLVLALGIKAKPVLWIKPSHVDTPGTWGRVVAERLKEKFDRTPKIILALPNDFAFESEQVQGFLQATQRDSELPSTEDLQSMTAQKLMEFLALPDHGVIYIPYDLAWDTRTALREKQFQHPFVMVYWTKFFSTWTNPPDCSSPRPVQWECERDATWKVHRRKFKANKSFFGILLQHSQFEYVSYLQASTELTPP